MNVFISINIFFIFEFSQKGIVAKANFTKCFHTLMVKAGSSLLLGTG